MIETSELEFETFTAKGGRRRSIADAQARCDEMDRRDPRCVHVVLSPSEAGILLFRTSNMGCLTHITRWVTDSVATYRDGVLSVAEAECGLSGGAGWWGARRRMVVVDPADETFGCHICIERAERYGQPTYGLIPDTGCSATGGERYRPRRRRLPPPAPDTALITADSVDDYLAALDAIDRYVN